MALADNLKRYAGRVAGITVASMLAGAGALSAARADHAAAATPAPMARVAAVKAAAVVLPAARPAPSPESAPTVVAPPAPVIAFRSPMPGFAMNSRFGLRRLADEGRSRMHEGVDFAAPAGSAIHATAPGRVIGAGVSDSYGRYVEVAHGDGVSSFYAHMSRAAGLRIGTPVRAGAVLGYVGSTGHSTGPHLHFEIRRYGAHYDPARFMGRSFAGYDALPFGRSAELIEASAARRARSHLYRVAYGGGRVHGTIASS